jgi:hypothetical protein
LTHRAGPQGVRPIVSEQAAFSSDREQVCRSYAREGAHGFCHARFGEARALALAARLGLNASSAAAAPAPRPRRAAPTQADFDPYQQTPASQPPAGQAPVARSTPDTVVPR